MTGADHDAAGMSDEARLIVDFTEIYVLDVQPLTPWQREVIRRLYAERTHGE